MLAWRAIALRRGFIAAVRQSENGEASQETDPGRENKRLARISPNETPGLGKRAFNGMIFDAGPRPVESFGSALREVVNRVQTLANRGRGAMEAR